MSFQEKYLKYKKKYLELKLQFGGAFIWEYEDDVLGSISPEIQQQIEDEFNVFLKSGKKKNIIEMI